MQLAKKIGIAALLSCSIGAHAAFDDTPPTTGAYYSGNYRNMFNEIGKSGIDSKVNSAVNKFFSGSSNEKLYYTSGSDKAYILDVHSNDVRSEGMSWGLTIAVMADKKSEFDKLWHFMHDHMLNTSGSFPGTFAWSVTTGGVKNDSGPAPDGELYTAFALFQAAARWGNGSGIYNYEQKANDVLDAMRNHLMDPYEKIIIFSPSDQPGGYFFTDPSYNIPAFYEYFADVANSNNSYWDEAATEARNFLQDHYNNTNTSHGLASYLAHFDGNPAGNLTRNGKPGDTYDVDAWRVVMNVGLDAHLMGAESWHQNIVNAQQDFFAGNTAASNGCSGQYAQYYTVWGGSYGTCGTNNWPHDIGQTSTLGAGSLAATNTTRATNALNDLWNGSYPTGQYRYYPGSLYVLSMLHASGKFKIHTSSGGGSSSSGGAGGSTSSSGGSGSNSFTVRMRGVDGSESVSLKVGGTTVATWTLNTSMSNYVTSTNLTGDILLDYTNDASGRDVQVDYLIVNGETRQAEDQTYNTGAWGNGSCGGAGASEWLHCSGAIGFGDVPGGSGGGSGGSGGSCLSYTYGSGLKELTFPSNSGGCIDIVGGNLQSAGNFKIADSDANPSCNIQGTATGSAGGSRTFTGEWNAMEGYLSGTTLTITTSNNCPYIKLRVNPS